MGTSQRPESHYRWPSLGRMERAGPKIENASGRSCDTKDGTRCDHLFLGNIPSPKEKSAFHAGIGNGSEGELAYDQQNVYMEDISDEELVVYESEVYSDDSNSDASIYSENQSGEESEGMYTGDSETSRSQKLDSLIKLSYEEMDVEELEEGELETESDEEKQ